MDMHRLLQLLEVPLSQHSAEDLQQEGVLLEVFAVEHAECYEFQSQAIPYEQFLTRLVTFRLLSADWSRCIPTDQKLRVMQCVRLLLRDARHQSQFVALGGVDAVCSALQSLAAQHFAVDSNSFNSSMLVECASIIKKLGADEQSIPMMHAGKVHLTLVCLLRTHNTALLSAVMVALIQLAQGPACAAAIGSGDCMDSLVRILEDYDALFRLLAADLLHVVCRQRCTCAELVASGGVGKLLLMVRTEDRELLEKLLRVLYTLTSDDEAVQELRERGVVGTLTSLLRSIHCGHIQPSELVLATLCSTIAKLVVDDQIAAQMRQQNGVYLLGMLLLDTDMNDKVRARVFRSLRFIYSMERNRKIFKRVFPPDLFALFIDIGHYQYDMELYADLARRFAGLTAQGREGVRAALEEINLEHDPHLQSICGYAVEEELGSGAFGTVYQVRKEAADNAPYALKRLALDHVGLFGATPQEMNQEVGKMSSEVKILSELNHPNIIRYYESFAHEGSLYIVMELADGVSLLDFLTSHSEKGARLPESTVWSILIQICRALRYIHVRKGVAHRDLSPTNVMVQQQQRGGVGGGGGGGAGDRGGVRVKLADFGLAKRKGAGSVMHSAVGTLPYSCPEIIQHQEYTDKADVWSLGCLLYFMLELRAPFDGSNPLSVASKIVEGEYAELRHAHLYSPELVGLVGKLLATDPAARPNIVEVCAMMANQVMDYVDQVDQLEVAAQKELEFERRRRRDESALAYKNEQAYRRLLGARETIDRPRARKLDPDPTHTLPTHPSGEGVSADGGVHQTPTELDAAPSGPTLFDSNQVTSIHSIASNVLPPLTRTVSQPVAASNGMAAPGPQSALLAPSNPFPSPNLLLSPPYPKPPKEPIRPSVSGRVGGGPSSEMIKLRHTRSSRARTVGIGIAPNRLRPISDPLAQMLTVLHKIMFIDMLPPGMEKDLRRRTIERYKRHLFHPKQNAGSMKKELTRLVDSSTEHVSGDLVAQHRLKYHELLVMMEDILHAHGYYESISETTNPMSATM